MKQEQVKKLIKSTLKEAKIGYIDDRWERHGNEWKLCYLIYSLSINNIFLPIVRLVWPFDSTKSELVDNKFIIMTSLGCRWQTVDIGTNPELSLKSSIIATCSGEIEELGKWILNIGLIPFVTEWQNCIDHQFYLKNIDEKIKLQIEWIPQFKNWKVENLIKSSSETVKKLVDYKIQE